MPFKTFCKQSSLAPTYRETLAFLLPPLTQQEELWLFCCSIRAILPASQLAVFPMWWSSTVRRPQARAGRDPWPLGQLTERKAFLWPIFQCTNSSGCPAFAQGSHKRVFHLCFEVAGEGCNPGTRQLPTAIFRCFSKLGFQVLSLPAGAGGRCRANHLLPAWPAVFEAASMHNRDSPVLHISMSLQQPAMLFWCEFCRITLPYLNPSENCSCLLGLPEPVPFTGLLLCLRYLTRNQQHLILIKSDNFFSATQTVNLKVAHTPLP